MPELDNRIGDYAADIVRDVDLLLADADSLNDEQQEYANEFRKQAVRFQSLYNELSSRFTELTQDSRVFAFDLRSPLGNVEGYCGLLLSGELGSWNQSQLQLLQRIKAAQVFISDAFITWVNSGQNRIAGFSERIVIYANSIVIYADALVAEGSTLSNEQQKYIVSISRAIQHLINKHTQYTSKQKILEDLNVVNDRSLALSIIIQMRQAILVALSNKDLVKLVGDIESWAKREDNNFKQMEAFILLIHDELNQVFEILSSS